MRDGAVRGVLSRGWVVLSRGGVCCPIQGVGGAVQRSAVWGWWCYTRGGDVHNRKWYHNTHLEQTDRLDWQTGAKNITLPQTLFAGGKKQGKTHLLLFHTWLWLLNFVKKNKMVPMLRSRLANAKVIWRSKYNNFTFPSFLWFMCYWKAFLLFFLSICKF